MHTIKYPIDTERYMLAAEALRTLGIHEATAWRWRRRGYLAARKVCGRVVYERREVQALAQRMRQARQLEGAPPIEARAAPAA